MRIDPATPPWEPASGAHLEHSWHFWDHPRWGYFALDGTLIAFHRHENVGAYRDGPSLWTYRPLAADGLLSLPEEQWGAPWQRVYEAWFARTPARWWAVADDDLYIVRWGEFVAPTFDDAAWAESFARLQGITDQKL